MNSSLVNQPNVFVGAILFSPRAIPMALIGQDFYPGRNTKKISLDGVDPYPNYTAKNGFLMTKNAFFLSLGGNK